MGQKLLKIANTTSSTVICHVKDFEDKPIQQTIASGETFELKTSKGYHTVFVYPIGTTSVQGAKAEASYTVNVKSDLSMKIETKGAFLNITKEIGTIQANKPNSITNKTDETILVLVTDEEGHSFEQILLAEGSYQFYALEGKMNISVFRPRETEPLTKYSFTGRGVIGGHRSIFFYHWEATITKVDGLLNVGVKEILDNSASG